MWNYYARGNGYNLGFDIDKIIENNEDPHLSITKVELLYDRNKQERMTLDCLLSFKDDLEEYLRLEEEMRSTKDSDLFYDAASDQIYIENHASSKINELGLRFKHHAYEREEEVRLIISDKSSRPNLNKFKVSENGVFVQYIPLALKIGSCLEAITIHPLNGALHLDGTKKFMAHNFPKHKIKIESSTIPFRMV